MKKTSPQNINAIVVSGSDTDDGRPGYPESNKDGTDTITIFDSDDEREMTHPRFENNVAIASATRGQNAQEIVALKMASAYVVFSGRTVGVFTDWKGIERAIAGYNNMSVKSYGSLEEAERAWKYAVTMGDIRPPSNLPISKRPANELVKYQYQGGVEVGQHALREGLDLCPPKKRPSASHRAADAGQAALYSHTSSSKLPSQPSKRARLSSLSIDIVMGNTRGKLYWVVIRGRRPGVYLQEEDAQKATMYCPHPVVEYTETQEEANQIFVTQFMAGKIEVVKQEHLDFHSS